MISDEKLNAAGELADSLRKYSDDQCGMPMIEDAAEMIDELVVAVQEAADERRSLINDVEGLVRKWRGQ